MSCRFVIWALLVVVSWCCQVWAVDLNVDCSSRIGSIRPLHGGNGGVIQDGELTDLSAYFRELNVPFTRLHDSHWPNPDVVDIHAIFPNTAADPELASSYDFARTDDFIRAIATTGTQIVYRLGESIEHSKKKFRVNPPPDAQRWAKVCLGTVRHYNEGWANGFRHDIKYWEIWNEPENRPAMWTGTDEEYLRLYEAAAKAIKSHDAKLKVGGPSLGYSGKFVDGRFEPSPFLLKFLARCKERSLPLDFLSWHLYTNDPSECVARAGGLRDLLNRNGFGKSELHLNEWNYLPANDWEPMGLKGQGEKRERFYAEMGGPAGAAFTACVLLNLQDSPVDLANYYSLDNQGFGVFNPSGTPKKAFYALKAFRMVLETPLRVQCRGGQLSKLVACAGTNSEQSQIGVLISNYSSPDRQVRLTISNLPWKGQVLCEIYRVDAANDLALTRKDYLPGGKIMVVQEMQAPCVCFLRLTRSRD